MEIKEFESLLRKYLEELDIDLNSEQILKFYNYMNLLTEWNKKINLTAIIEPKDIIIKHMWPVTFAFPKSTEGFILTFVDKYCALSESFDVIQSKIFKKRVSRYAYILLSLLIIRL